MNANDLFSFLDEDAPADDHSNEMQTDSVPTPKSKQHGPVPLKRKAISPSPIPQNGRALSPKTQSSHGDSDTQMREPDEPIPGPSVPKKPRMASPKPIVLDDFETEAKREIAASAGLTEAVESGSRLELKHQVR